MTRNLSHTWYRRAMRSGERGHCDPSRLDEPALEVTTRRWWLHPASQSDIRPSLPHGRGMGKAAIDTRLHRTRRLYSLDPDSPLRARICSSSALSSALSWASINAPRFGLTSPCNSCGRPKASPKLPPDCLQTYQCGAELAHSESVSSRASHSSLYFEDLVEVHLLWR